MDLDDKKWKIIKRVFKKAQFTSFHYSIATVNRRGEPHVSPIGLVILKDDMTGVYFEEHLSNTPKHYDTKNRVCIMAVNTGKLFWLKSLLKGAMREPMAVRILGTAGERRPATKEELSAINRLTRPYKWTKGYDLIWKKITSVREIKFDSYEPVKVGAMTAGLEV
jgi:hypothetical protein